jgi:Zn-dependent protease with chaperone function
MVKSIGMASIVSAIVIFGFTMACGQCSYNYLPHIVVGVFTSFLTLSYIFSTHIMRLLYRPTKDDGYISKFMKKEAKSIGVRKPNLYIFHDKKPIAFSVNSLEKAIFLSTGILNKLNEEEVKGVILHELHHLKSRWGKIKWVLHSLKKSTLFDLIIPIPVYELDQLQEEEIDKILLKRYGIDTNLIRKKLH